MRGAGMRWIWRWLLIGGVVVVAFTVAGWYFVLRSEAEPRPEIELTPTVAKPARALQGSWSIAPGHPKTFVGYRVTEKLPAAIAEQETTGRTNNLTARMVVRGTSVTKVKVTADLRDLTSDSGLRDSAIRSTALESNDFPFGTFELTEPIRFRAAPEVGRTVEARAKGNLTLHGVTKRVTVAVEARWDGKRIQVIGSHPILFSDYDIDPPSVPATASVDNKGEMEFHLFFRKA
jgi:polyisoprenoid-binding protein YceI